MNAEAKPWGNYRTLFADAGYQVKRIEVLPGLRLSLQKHAKRAEQWTVVSGSGTAVVGTRQVEMKPGVTVSIGVGELHRMHNTGKKPLVFIELQFGDYLGEDDIVRVEDDYNRR